MTSDQLKTALKLHGSDHVYNQFLLNQDCHIFIQMFNLSKSAEKEHPGATYHRFKNVVSEALAVSVPNIAIVGSAKVGYSLTPSKNFSPFHVDSDIDLVIVSPDKFRSLWGSYFEYANSFEGKGRSYNDVAKNVFRHFVSVKTEEITGSKVEFFKDWITKVDELRRTIQLQFKLPYEINYRVYEDWEYVRRYHVSGLDELKEKV